METWRIILISALSLNAVLGFGYRVYRLSKGGPLGDVVGQAILGVILGGVAVAVAAELAWARWVALAYALVFGLLVMPIWTLAVLIPLKPGKIDYGFTVLYWVSLVLIGVAAIAL